MVGSWLKDRLTKRPIGKACRTWSVKDKEAKRKQAFWCGVESRKPRKERVEVSMRSECVKRGEKNARRLFMGVRARPRPQAHCSCMIQGGK